MGALAMDKRNTRTVTEVVGPVGLGVNGIQGWSFWMTAKYDAADLDTQAVFQKLPGAWAIQSNGNSTTAGVVICTINPADTASLPPYQVDLVFDVKAKDALGNIFTIDSGVLTVSADVTDTAS